MKKFFAVFALVCAVFLISCGDDAKKVYPESENEDEDSVKAQGELGGECYPNKTCNEGLICDTGNNQCVEDNAGNDADTNTDEDTAEDAEILDDDAEEGDARKADCDPKPENAVWNDEGADGKFVQTFDGEKWTPETHESVYGETPDTCVFKCDEGFAWNESECADGPRKVACEGLPENAEWNKAEKISQEWDGEKWTPSNEGTYNTQESADECRFKCKENYTWSESDSSCKAGSRTHKCTDKPDHSYWNTADEISQTWNGEKWEPAETGTYSETPSDKECFFICESGFFYDETLLSCLDPCDKCKTVEHSVTGGTCKMTDANEYYCECERPYIWDSTSKKCKKLPECSTANVTPCQYNGLIWSARTDSAMTVANAQKHCTNLDEGGFKDWRLPTISELRKLIKNCPNSVIEGTCGVRSEAFGEEGEDGYQPACTCTSCRKDTCEQNSCEEDLNGRYTPFGAADASLNPPKFWSSTPRCSEDHSQNYWTVWFSNAYIGNQKNDEKDWVRCVR